MALTAAEKQKRYRDKLKNNPQKHEEAKKKHRERYHKTKRLVKDLNPQERYYANVIWRLRKRTLAKRKKDLQKCLQRTPPDSPIPGPGFDIQNETPSTSPTPPPDIPPPPANPRRATPTVRGRKKVKKDRSKVHRQNQELQKKNELLKRKYEKYKKRYLRQNKADKVETSGRTEQTKYKVLSGAINETFKKTKSRKEREVIRKIFTNVQIKDSRMKKKLLLENLGVDKIAKMKFCLDRVTVLKKKIKDFYIRDDISRATAGKKETVTKNGVKAQKRFLLDFIKNTYNAFKKENPDLRCSYFYFAKNKPFFVVSASADARDMCCCKTHTNIEFKAKALKKKGIIGTDTLNIYIEYTVCNVNSKQCMYGMCDECANKKMNYNAENIKGIITWTEWVRKEEIYVKDGKKIKAVKSVKEELSEEADKFLKAFHKDLAAFKKHVFNIKTQFKNFRRCVENIRPNECIIVADFSENYNCKYSEEVQSFHFGGSRKQITLHTVVVYVFDKDLPQGYKVHSFCTISASTNHQPAAIWSHFDPILKWIRSNFESIDTVHFHSDEPSTQYRQKQNFFLMCTKLFGYGFDKMTWSFFEAGHGKGPADGIGGFLKRTADKIVANGEDISNILQFYKKMKSISKIKLYLIDEKEIEHLQKALPTNIPRLLGTLNVHHVFSESYGILKYRELGCFCEMEYSDKRGFCDCLSPNIYDVRNYHYKEKVDDVTMDSGLEETNETNDPKTLDLAKQTVFDDIPTQSKYCTTSKQPLPNENPDTSDDDETLMSIKISKDLRDVTNNHTSIYNKVFGLSSDEEEPGLSYAKDSKIGCGDFLLVKLYVDNSRTKAFTYACKALTDIEEDGEVKVVFLRVVDENAKRFRIDEKDISYVDFDDIMQKLPRPDMIKRVHRTYYEFKESVNVFEKK